MVTKDEFLGRSPTMHEFESAMNTYMLILSLNDLSRSGYIKRGVKKERCQSVLDHLKNTGRLAFVCAYIWRIMPENLDKDKVINMCFLHDTIEAKIGDYIPGEISKEEKKRLEIAAANEMFRDFPYGNDKKCLELVLEFIENKTPEAQYANQLDKLEAVITAKQYEKQGHKSMTDFYEWTSPYITDPELKKILEKVIADVVE